MISGTSLVRSAIFSADKNPDLTNYIQFKLSQFKKKLA